MGNLPFFSLEADSSFKFDRRKGRLECFRFLNRLQVKGSQRVNG